MQPYSSPLRRIVLSPEKLVCHLHLTRTSRVLEVGPGPGFFSIDVAHAIPEGRIELIDIQREMLRKARGRLSAAGVQNASYTQANAVKLPFQSGIFDVAFLVAVLGEVPDPKACLGSIADVLRPGGVLPFREFRRLHRRELRAQKRGQLEVVGILATTGAS